MKTEFYLDIDEDIVMNMSINANSTAHLILKVTQMLG